MHKNSVIAFDVFGTLMDTAGIARALSAHTANAAAFAARWRDKQLEYTFRRALMGCYADFAECTHAALDWVCADFNCDIPPAARRVLMQQYHQLPAYADAAPCLSALQQRHYAFSNGAAAMVREILSAANLLDSFCDIVSVEEVRLFKPAPAVYAHFLQTAATPAADTCLISGNPFDIMGARAAGWQAVWVNRGGAVFDPWHEEAFQPTATIASLEELPPLFA